MKKIILVLFFLGISINLSSQAYDTKYSSEYVLKDNGGNILNSFIHYRSGDRLKFVKVNNKGKDNETTTEIFVFKNERKVYMVISGKNFKSGSRFAMDINSVFMQTGVYIFDLGNDGSIFNNKTKVGPEMVYNRECIRYNLVPSDAPPGGITDYYFYQDNLMLKRVVGSVQENNTIEAISYDANGDVPESLFTLPSGVEFTDY